MRSAAIGRLAEEGFVKLTVLLILLGVGSASTACARHAGVEAGQVQPAAAVASVNVRNGYELPMSIFATGTNGVPIKLGTVSPGSTGRFTVDEAIIRLGMLHILAQPPGGGRLVDSGPLSLKPGDLVDFEIGFDLVGSRAVIR